MGALGMQRLSGMPKVLIRLLAYIYLTVKCDDNPFLFHGESCHILR